jgi:PAS domain S-box-containing protein
MNLGTGHSQTGGFGRGRPAGRRGAGLRRGSTIVELCLAQAVVLGHLWPSLLLAGLGVLTLLLLILAWRFGLARRRRRELAQREARFEALLGLLDDVFWMTTSDGRVLYMSPSVREVYGRPCEEFYANPNLWREVIVPEDRQRVPDILAEPTHDPQICLEYRIQRPDGSICWIEDRKSCLSVDASGQAVFGGIATDITRRKQSQRSLQESEQTYRALFENSNAVKILIDPESGRIVDANEAACQYYGYSRPELTSMRIQEINRLSEEGVEAEMARAKELDLNHFFFLHRLRDGRVRDVEVYSNPVEIRGRKLLFSIIHDVTDRKRAERALKEHERELKMLARQLALVEERNRQQVAAVLHDRIGQTLAALKVRAGLIGQAAGTDEAASQARKLMAQLDELMEETWSLTFELCPPALYEVGLEAALEWLCSETAQRSRVEVSYTDDGSDKPLTGELRGMVFQMTRELLNNAIRHGRPGRVEIETRRYGGELRIVVEDDGAGFDPEAQKYDNQSVGGFGLLSIRERLGHFGGRLEAGSAPGRGARMTLVLPLTNRPDPSERKDQEYAPDHDHPG